MTTSIADTKPERMGLLHPDWTQSPWRECARHWDSVRAGLKPFRFPPTPPTLFMELTDDERKDVEAFKARRALELAKNG